MEQFEPHDWYKQYLKLKSQAPGVILLLRFGDYYEAFDGDARLIAKLLEFALTRKECGIDKSQPQEAQKIYVPMVGMPYHAVDRYITDLTNRGYVIRIVTPGKRGYAVLGTIAK